MYRIIFRGKMRNGNTAIQKKIENVTFDITPPEIQLLMNKRISRPEIAFDSSEPLQSAILKWLPGIYEDTIPSLEVQLSSADLWKAGSGRFIPEMNPDIIDSLIYDVTLNGIDRAGNMGETAVALGIRCDKTPPIKVLSPQQGEYVNNMNLYFFLNEKLNEGTFTIKRPEKSNHPQILSIVNIPDTLLNIGEHNFNLEQSFTFVDGMTYSITIFCKDIFGYDSNRPTIDSLHFDVSSPVISIINPSNDSFVNHYEYTYSTNEPVNLIKFHWDNIGLIQDTFAPHEYLLKREELFKGDLIQISFDLFQNFLIFHKI